MSTVSLRIINYGGDTGEYSIEATIDGQRATSEGKLTPAEQGAATFTFTPTRAGTHQITANGFSGSFEVKRPRGTLTVISWNVPTSSPRGSVACSVTYQVTGYIEYGAFYITLGTAPGIFIGAVPVTEGTHTFPFGYWMPSDGYKYMNCGAGIEYGVSYEWTGMAYQAFAIYLEEEAAPPEEPTIRCPYCGQTIVSTVGGYCPYCWNYIGY